MAKGGGGTGWSSTGWGGRVQAALLERGTGQAGDAAARAVAGEASCTAGKAGSAAVIAARVKVSPSSSVTSLCASGFQRWRSPFPFFRKVYMKL